MKRKTQLSDVSAKAYSGSIRGVLVLTGLLAGTRDVGSQGTFQIAQWPCTFSDLFHHVLRVREGEYADRVAMLHLIGPQSDLTVSDVDSRREGLRAWLLRANMANGWCVEDREQVALLLDQLAAVEPPLVVDFGGYSIHQAEHAALALHRWLSMLDLNDTFHGNSLLSTLAGRSLQSGLNGRTG